MAKKKEIEVSKSHAQTIAEHQRLGYVPRDEYELFCEIAKRARLRVDETKLGEVLKVAIGQTKFYTENK